MIFYVLESFILTYFGIKYPYYVLDRQYQGNSGRTEETHLQWWKTVEDSGAGWSSTMGKEDVGYGWAVPASEYLWPWQVFAGPFTSPV